MDDYGNYYPEEDSDDVGPQFAQNYPPGSMFQGEANTAGMGSGISAVSGVPFYGQQQRQAASSGGFTYGGIGGGAGTFMSGAAPTQQANSGGFTYGMASKGGNLFGPPATGASSNPLMGGTQFGSTTTTGNSNPGLFQFGKVSSFGGLGQASTFGAGTAAGLFGSSAAADDPYANIAIDLNKVKKSEPPPKLHELKTEEEKKKEAEAKKSSSSAVATKSNLKKEFDKDKVEGEDGTTKRKRSVTFGKSTTYEVERGDTDESTEFINKDNVGGRGSPRPVDKKVIEEKDLSDGRSEKEKILEMLEKQQREQLEEIQQMSEMQSKQDESKQKTNVEDSVGDSSSSVPAKKAEASGSYESDFEDVSMSGSGSKQKLTYWPGKQAFNKQDSASVSQSLDKEEDKYDAKAMEEYMKKQQQKQQSTTYQSQHKQTTSYDQSESSDRYEEDFESISKSQTALTSSMLQSPSNNKQTTAQQIPNQQKSTFEYKPVEFKSVADQYKKKENKFIQTEETKYDHMTPDQQTSGSYKEWTLQQHLKDAENLIQELKSEQADYKEKIKDLEVQLKKKDVEFQTARRESLNANETAKRLQEQLKDAVHKNNLYKIETEELIKQIDLADAKTRNKEDELKLAQAEFDRKLKLQEERILFRVSKQEERETLELKRQHMLEKEELQNKVSEQQEEIDYLMQKVSKIEVENKSLRLGKDSNKKIKELEDEIELLKHQLSTSYQVQEENLNLRNIKNDLSKEDQVKLQRELQQLELMVKGYQEENEKAMIKQKQLERDLKMAQEKAMNEAKKVKDLQQKALLNSDKVYVEESKEELDIQTVNNMGLGNAISHKTLQDMHSQIQKLQNEKQDHERDAAIKEGQLKSQINKLKDEKQQIEKQLYDTEFLLGDKDREIQKIRDEFQTTKDQLTDQIKELEEKVAWFRQNQRLIAEEDADKENMMKELYQLRDRTKKLEEDTKRMKDLEKKCKLLEETIKSKNPNSIPLMLQAVKETASNGKLSSNEDKKRISQLEAELEQKDKEFEKKLRTLRQEQERMKQLYEKRQGQTPEAKRIQELEDELQKTKTYYNKRIREIEDKYKFRIPDKSKPPTTKGIKEQQPQIDISEGKNYEEIIEKLTKERNFLAQKVVNLETMNIRRRQSTTGLQMPTITDDSKHAFSAIYSIGSMLKNIGSQGSKEGSFTLIEAALTCVEQLKQKDPFKNKQLSQLLLQLTQELNQDSQINDKVLNELISLCKKEISSTSQKQNDLSQNQQQSFGMNKDLTNVMESFTENDQNNSTTNPFKTVTHPFVVNTSNQSRSVKEVLKAIVQSGIDFERIVKEKEFNPHKIQINQLYQILREEEQGLKQISLDEVRSIINFVREKNSGDCEEIGRGKSDEIALQDLMNVIMDVSLDVFGGKDVNDSLSLPPTRYSQDPLSKSPNQDETRKLKEQLKKLQEKLDMKESGFTDKFERMQKALNQLQNERQHLLDKIEKLESSKSRVERILKQSVGNRSTLRKTAGGLENVDSNELFDEIAVLMKRIEFLEQQSEEREKMVYQEHGPCKRELQRLQQELIDERQDKQRLLAKKNSEVAYFKAELDALLSEMKNTITNKKARVPQY